MMFFYIDLSDQILSSEAISPAFESKNVHECKKNSVYHQSCQISRKNFHESNRSIIYKLFVLTHKVINQYNINCIGNDPKKNKVVIRGDGTASYQTVVKVIDEINAAGVTRFNLAMVKGPGGSQTPADSESTESNEAQEQ
jgi:hypothetical protein